MTVIEFTPGLVPVLKHGEHDQSTHGRWSSKHLKMTDDEIKSLYEGALTSNGVTVYPKVDEIKRGESGKVAVYGRLYATDQTGEKYSFDHVGEFARSYDPSTKTAKMEALSIGANLWDQEYIPGAMEFRGKGLAAEFHKRSERAALAMGATTIKVSAESDGTEAWASKRFGYEFAKPPKGLDKDLLESRFPSLRPDEGGNGWDEKAPYQAPFNARLAKKVDSLFTRFDGPRSDWPTPSELSRVGENDEKYGWRPTAVVSRDDSVGTFILRQGWEGQKPADRMTKQAAGEMIYLIVEGDDSDSVAKHAQHNQSDHGRRGSSGSGISVENVTSHQESGVTVYTGTTAPGTVAYRGVRGSELWGPAGAATNGVWRSFGGYNTSVEGGPGGSTMFASNPDELTDKVHRYTHIVKADIGGLPFRTLREPQGGQVNADMGLGLGITGEIPLSRIISVTGARDGRDSTDFFWRQVEEGGFPVAKHGTHDQSDHGRRGSGSPTGRALDPTNEDDVREAFTGTIETRAGTVNVVVDSVDVFDFSTSAQGQLVDSQNRVVGQWARTIVPETGTMYNESLNINTAYQFKGIATEFQKRSEKAAMSLGMERIGIKAAMDGKEAWASERFGFDFAGPPSEGLYTTSLRLRGEGRNADADSLDKLANKFDGPEESWPRPHEILAFGSGSSPVPGRYNEDAATIGQTVLSYGWDGKKPASRVTKRVEPEMFYVTVESDYADVAKHGSHNQSDHGRRGAGSGSKNESSADVAESDGYRMSHQPDTSGPSVSNLDETYPGIYENPQWYSGGEKADRESLAVINRVRGNPEAPVTIYRAVVPGVTKINPGDWVSLSRTYAVEHGMHATDGSKDMPVLSMEVKAKHVREGSGNSINEWGYNPDSNVTKHGIHDQSSHGNWAHGKGTGSHAGEAKMGPASATDGYGNARGTTYISGNRGETQTPLPDGWFRATDQEHDDYDRAAMRAMMRPEMLEGIDKGSPLEDDYLRAYRSVAASKVQLFAGPNGTGVVVQGEISWRDDFTPEDFVQNLKQISELQRVTPAPGLQVIVGTQEFSKHSFDESTRGFVDTRDVDTMHLRPSALSAGNKYDVEGSRRWDNLMSTSEANRPVYALTHEYGHVVDRRSNESALADFNEVVQSNRGLITGSSPYAREGYFGEGAGGRGLQVGDKPTGREMYAEAWTGWVLSKGWAARNPGMVQFFAEKYGWDSETGTAPMAKAKVKGRIYMDSFGPEGGWVLDSLPGESATVAFAPGLKPVLKHAQHNQSDHGRRGGGGGGGSQDGGVTPVVNDFTDSDGNLAKPMSMRDSDHPDEVITVIPARANPMDGLNVVSIYKGEEQAGVMRYEPYSGKVEWINVEEKFRRQGVATRLWEAGKYVAARHPNMIEPKHSQSQTTEGAAWASVVKFYRSIEVNDGMAKHGNHAQLSHGNRSKGIDRTEMPQIPKANREAFLAELTDSGISHREEAVDPRDLRRTQRAIDPANVAQMHAAMVAGTMKEGLPIIVSSDGKVLDGHHRWAAAAQLAGEVPGTTVKITRVDMKMDDLLARARKFNEEQGIAARAIGEVRPVAKHGQHDQSSHGRKGGGQSTAPVPVTPESVAKAFDGTYTTDSGLQFTLASRSSTGAGGGSVTVEGEILVGDAVVGKWVRKVSGTTMYAEALNVGKDFDGNSLPGAEQFQGKGIALEVQKQTEKAARELGCTEIRVSAMSDGVAAWAQERFGYRFEEKPSLRATSKAGREPRDDAERAVPLGGVGYPNGSREYRGEDGLMYGFSHPDLGVPAVRNALAKVEQRFKSDDRDDWPSPSEVVSLGTGRRVDDDIIEGRTLGEFLLSRGWSGVKSADHVTKAVGGVVRVVVEGVERPVAKHGTHDQKDHGRRYSGKVDAAVAAKAIRLVGEYGGLSIKMTDGSEPPDGYMVARNSSKFGIAVTADEFFGPRGAEHLATMVLKNRTILGSGRAYLGVWHQTEITNEDGSKTPLARKDQVVHLDVTDRILGEARAVSLGRRRDQISIWDVVNTEEIQTGGKGADVEKHYGGSNPEAVVEDDGRRRSGVGERGPRAVSQTGRRAVAVVKFSPGLVPVLKHGTTHNEADHGRRRGSSSAEIASSEASGEVDYMMREGRWLDEQLSRDGMAMPPPPGVLDYIAKAADKVEEWVDRRLNPPLESLPKAEITQIVMANRARVDASRAARGLPPTQWPEWDGGSVEKADADVVDILRRLFAGEVDDRLFQLMKRDERPLVERDGPFADLLDVMLNAVARVAGDESVTKHEQHNQKDHGRRGSGGQGSGAVEEIPEELRKIFDYSAGRVKPLSEGERTEADDFLLNAARGWASKNGYSMNDAPHDQLSSATIYAGAVVRRAMDQRLQDEEWAETSEGDAAKVKEVFDAWRREGHVMVAVPSDYLDDILRDGVKNQFETGESGGVLDNDVRAVDELAHHGIRPGAPGEERPVYGYIGRPGEEHPLAVHNYGDVTLVLKDSARSRTTVTLGDSLNTHATPVPLDGEVTARQVSDASARTVFGNDHKVAAKHGSKPLDRGVMYMEAQIMGGVRLEDISRIVFGPNADIDVEGGGVGMLANEMRPFGISVDVMDGY